MYRYSWTALALVLALGSCGDDYNSQPVSNPTPTPTQTAIPTPTPTPTATSTPASDPGGALLGSLEVPGNLRGLLPCYSGAVQTKDGRVTDVAPGGTVKTDNFFSISVGSDYTYTTDTNGFGGVTYDPSSRVGGTAFEVFVKANSELQIAKRPSDLQFATYGMNSDYDYVCFFAVMPEKTVDAPETGQKTYIGVADGLYTTASDTDRLYGTEAIFDLDPTTPGTYDLTIHLRTVEKAFDEPAGQTQTSIGSATARINYSGPASFGQFKGVSLSGPDGFSGTVRGYLGGYNRLGAIFVFSMQNEAGDVIWGVIAADGALL